MHVDVAIPAQRLANNYWTYVVCVAVGHLPGRVAV